MFIMKMTLLICMIHIQHLMQEESERSAKRQLSFRHPVISCQQTEPSAMKRKGQYPSNRRRPFLSSKDDCLLFSLTTPSLVSTMNKLDDDHQKEWPSIPEASMPDEAEAIEDKEYQYWMDRVTKCCWDIENAPAHIRENQMIFMAAVASIPDDSEVIDDKEHQYWMDRVQKHGRNLKDAPAHIRSDKKIVKAAVQQTGWVLQYALPAMQNDKEVVKAAVEKSGEALKYALPEIQNDKDVVKAAVDQYGSALKYASPAIQNDKEVVKVAVEQDGRALEYASPELQDDKETVSIAYRNSGAALQHASDEVLDDKEFILSCCREKPEALKFASGRLRADKDVVLASVSVEPLLLKYALGGLNQDRDCLIAAGIWDEEIYPGDDRKQITLSTRFAQDPGSKSQATLFTLLFKEDPYVKEKFSLYSPNAWAKDTCDPKWTRFEHPCRGTFATCEKPNDLKKGEPMSDCCWRYSFRYQLERSKKTNGFMLQILEAASGRHHYGEKQFFQSDGGRKLGNGQRIEKHMAEDLQVKVFRVSAPMYDHHGDVLFELPFAKNEIEKVVVKIREWYDEGCKDMSECKIDFDYYSGDEEDRRILELRKIQKSRFNVF